MFFRENLSDYFSGRLDIEFIYARVHIIYNVNISPLLRDYLLHLIGRRGIACIDNGDFVIYVS
jgi:hypothetical protein